MVQVCQSEYFVLGCTASSRGWSGMEAKRSVAYHLSPYMHGWRIMWVAGEHTSTQRHAVKRTEGVVGINIEA